MSASGEEAAVVESAAKDTGEALGSAGGKLSGFADTTADKVEQGMDRLAQTETDNVTLSTDATPHTPTLPEGDVTPATPTDDLPPEGAPSNALPEGDPLADQPSVGHETPDGGWEGPNPKLYLTPDENAAAKQFLAQAKDAEPGISSIMSSVKDAAPGAELEGYPKFVLKELDSFQRKLADELADNVDDVVFPERDVQDGLSNMKDTVRYTIKIPDAGTSYADGVQAAVGRLEAAGATSFDWKNTWEQPGYQGINSFWKDPTTGHIFEVQFHTQESFTAKMETHELFEEQRIRGTPEERKLELQQMQDQLFDAVPRPTGAANIPRPSGLTTGIGRG